MPNGQSDVRIRALSRWDNEGGAIATAEAEAEAYVPNVTNAELVFAHENLLIAVLAEGSDHQRQTARKIPEIILPRSSATQHSLTIRASQHMTDLIDRAAHIMAAD